MENILQEIKNLPISVENINEKEKRYFQFSEKEGEEHHGSAVVFNERDKPKSVEFWYKSWRIAHIPINYSHIVPTVKSTSFIRMEGTITKEGNKRKSKKKRWFKLNEHEFSYYKTESTKKPIDVVSMGVVQRISKANMPNVFHLFSANRVYVFQLEDEITFNSWYEIFRAMIKLRKMIRANSVIIDEFLSRPKSLVGLLNKKNYQILESITGRGPFLYFISRNNINEIEEMMSKSQFISDHDLNQLSRVTNNIKNWDSFDLQVSMMKLCRKRSIELDFAIVTQWLENIHKSSEKDQKKQTLSFDFQKDLQDLLLINNPNNDKQEIIDQFILQDSRLQEVLIDEVKNLKLQTIELTEKMHIISSKMQEIQKKKEEVENLLRKELESKKKEIESKEELTKKLKEAQENLQTKANEFEERNKKNEEKSNKEKEKSKLEISELQKSLEKSKKNFKELEKKYEKSQQELENKTKELNKTNERKSDLQKKFDDSQKKLTKTKQELENSQLSSQTYKQRNSEIEQEKSKLEEKIYNLESDLNETKKKNQQLNNTISENSATISQLQSQMQKISTDFEKKKTNEAQKNEEIEKKNIEIMDLKEKINDYLKTIEEEKAKLKIFQSSDDDESKNHLLKITEEQQEERKKLLDLKVKLESQNLQQSNMIEQLKNNQMDKEKIISEKEEEIKKLTLKNEKLKQEIQESEGVSKKRAEEMNQLHSKKYELLSLENNQLKIQNQNFQSQISQLISMHHQNQQNNIKEQTIQTPIKEENSQIINPSESKIPNQEDNPPKQNPDKNEQVTLSKDETQFIEDLKKTVSQFKEHFEVKYKDSPEAGNEKKNSDLHSLVQETLWKNIESLILKGFRKIKKMGFGSNSIWNILESCAKKNSLPNKTKNIPNLENDFKLFQQAIKFINSYEKFSKKDVEIKFRAFLRWSLNEKKMSSWFLVLSVFNELLHKFYENSWHSTLQKRLESISEIVQPLANYSFKCFINLEVQKRK